MIRGNVTVGLLVSVAMLLGCQSESEHRHGNAGTKVEHKHANMWEKVNEAVAVMHPTQGNQAHGTVRFTKMGDRVRVVADLQGLPPSSRLGFHVHEFGDCTAADATSAGGHYNPEGHQHAGPQTMPRHAGDFGNIESDAQGHGRLELTVDNITIADLRNPVIGRAVIVHAKADDLKSQPTGDAGGRIACGVIGIANPGK